MENMIQYGPYSPQEVDQMVPWLQSQQIQFEIIRNDQEAKEALMNDGQNIVNLADLRTGIYLAQVFYMNLKAPNEAQKKSFEDRYCMKAEVYQSKRPEVANDDQQVAIDSRRNHSKKRNWSILLSVLMITLVVINFYYLVLKEH